MPLILASITGHLTTLIGDHGAYAVFAVMMIDAVFPAGSEIVMLYAGALASGALTHKAVLFGATVHDGWRAYVVMALAGTLGYLVGAVIGWYVGARGGHAFLERRGRWLHLNPARLRRAEDWFERFGPWAVFLGRLTPIARSFISIPAGVLGSPLGPYTVRTLAGSLIWCFGLAGAGWALGASYEEAHHDLRFFDYAGAAALVALVAAAALGWWRTRSSD